MKDLTDTKTQTGSLLLVNRSAPYSSANARESVDVALAAAAFEVPVNVLFIEDGCYQLLANQQAGKIDGKQLSRMFGAFAIYGIDKLYVCESSVNERGIESQLEALPVTFASKGLIRDLHREAHTVLRF